MQYDIKEMSAKLQHKMKEKRFVHTVGVLYTAAALAMRYEENIENASVAGLLHDNAKYFSDEKMIAKCEKYEIEIREVERRNPYLLHAKLGAFYAKKDYNIEDSEILDAIACHTTGKPAMTMLEKILFAADFIEPNRKMVDGMDCIRKECFVNIDRGVALILGRTLNYLGEAGVKKEIDEQTVRAYDYYKMKL